MRRLRDIFYINGNYEEKYYIYYGIEFREFRKYLPIELENLLIFAGGGVIGDYYNPIWNLEAVRGLKSIEEMGNEDLYALGNFQWVDYNNENSLNDCCEEEKAELLYLTHFGKPLNSPFINRINNNFAYLAHDDGWFCKLYCKDMSIINEVIGNKILDHFSEKIGEKLCSMDKEIKSKLSEHITEGLLIDFDNIMKCSDNSWCVAIYSIGEFHDMDEVYNNREKHIMKSTRKSFIEYTNGKWSIEAY